MLREKIFTDERFFTHYETLFTSLLRPMAGTHGTELGVATIGAGVVGLHSAYHLLNATPNLDNKLR